MNELLDETIHIAIATDENYAGLAGALVRSLIVSDHKRSLVIHFLISSGFSEESKRKISNIVQSHSDSALLIFHEIPSEWTKDLPGCETAPQISNVAWYRIFLPQLLGEINKVLYLDADTIVLKPLDELWEIDVSNYALASVTDFWTRPHIRDYDFHNHIKRLGLPNAASYFNSGVMLLNLQEFRKKNWTQKIVDYALRNRKLLLWVDQCALNSVLRDHRLPLEVFWNVTPNVFLCNGPKGLFDKESLDKARKHPAIIHFCGAKPWDHRCLHPLWERYYEFASATPWIPAKPTMSAHRKFCLRHAILQRALPHYDRSAFKHWIGAFMGNLRMRLARINRL